MTQVVNGDLLNEQVPNELYHGSANEFSRFDASQIGSGAGNAVHGYGIYLTDSRDVAEYYANDLSFGKGGLIYTVRIPSNLNLLGWEEEIDEMTARDIRDEFETYIDDASEMDDLDDVLGLSEDYYGEHPTMSSLYDYLQDVLGSNQKATQLLLYSNIDGVQFNSKENGTNATNYTIFDPERIKILDVEQLGTNIHELHHIIGNIVTENFGISDDEWAKAHMDNINQKRGGLLTKVIDNPNFVYSLPKNVLNTDYGQPNRCETNVYNFIKNKLQVGETNFYPVGGFIFEGTTYMPIEHWWVYDVNSNKHIDVTPTHPDAQVRFYAGVINKDIQDEIANTKNFYDVDFFKGGNVENWYFK